MDPGLPGQMQQPSATPGQGTPPLPSPLSCPSPSYLFSNLSYPTVASFFFPGVSARRPEIQNLFCNKPSPSLPPPLVAIESDRRRCGNHPLLLYPLPKPSP